MVVEVLLLVDPAHLVEAAPEERVVVQAGIVARVIDVELRAHHRRRGWRLKQQSRVKFRTFVK